MVTGEPIDLKNLDIYGAAPIPWSRARDQLERVVTGEGPTLEPAASLSYWLATARPDGQPHVVAVGALWIDGLFYFTSGPRTRKSRDLAVNPRCVISVSLPDIDLAVDGTAARVSDEATLERVAERYAAQGWPARVEDGAITAEFSAPSAGPPPWHLYQVTPTSAVGVATAEPHGATRWQFTG